MKPAAREWVRKAEGDFRTARRESRVRSAPNHDAVCFHAQQCAEKYLKALLTDAGTVFPRIHDLVKLADLCPSRMARIMGGIRDDIDLLSRFSVACRYPGEVAGRREASEAIAAVGRARKTMRALLGLRR